MSEAVQQKPGGVANALTKTVLQFMAFCFSDIKSYRKYLKTVDGWEEFSIGLCTEDGRVQQSIWFKDGKAHVKSGIKGVDTEVILRDTSVLAELASLPPNEVLNLMLKNKMSSRGNMSYLEYFNLLISVLMKNKQAKQMAKQKSEEKTFGMAMSDGAPKPRPKMEFLKAESANKGVKYIADDPYLSEYSLDDFPRLKGFLKIHFEKTPEVCVERALIITHFFRENGFETKKDGTPWMPELRQGCMYKYLMENRRPIIRKDDLIAGTTTTKEIGVPVYPDAVGTIFWGELLTVQDRVLNSYAKLSDEDVFLLNSDIFPFWAKRNFREWVREKYDNPLCQKLDERWAVIFMWKTVALSHTILDYPKLLRLGLRSIIDEANAELERDKDAPQSKKDFLKAIVLCYEGIIAYAHNLAEQCRLDSKKESDAKRKQELLHLAETVAHSPEFPARTLDEAVNAIWIHWVAVHMESTNAGFSLGRMDQWLQPFFEADMARLETEEARKAYIKHAIEIIGCFYMRCTDHLPIIPDIGNYLFGGSSSDQAITLGGVTPENEDAVNDMTYIFLKVTEFLSIRDPNVNARYNNKKNSQTYLKRLCEVNVNTTATPSIHNDEMVMASLADFHYPPEHLRDWSATGCVEPTLSGRHLGHTNCMMFNMVAALEMAMFNGYHPLMRWDLGPKTGEPESFKTFDSFFEAFCTQLAFLGDLACQYNNYLGEAHSVIRPTPMMSAMLDGCIEKGLDCTKGGASYNSSGNACIGLADIVDSLMAIKKLVFDDKKYTLREVCEGVKKNFEGFEVMRSKMLNSVPLFGSGSEEALELANRVTKFVKDCFWEHTNFRGGHYTAGFWSMSNHVAFGTLTGALPSGRLAGMPFTPGLTPEGHASKSLLDNIKDVARLKPENMNNNIAFNVKVTPASGDTHAETVDHLYSYAKTYADLGGMQMQFNVVSSETMRTAMANPDAYRDLMVRISGYNAYFVTLNRELQLELVRRAEYNI